MQTEPPTTISRRAFFGVAAGAATAAAPAQTKRPNVLFIIADDLNTDLACFGVAAVKTPNLDRLAARAVRFDRAYCQYPLCNPSRTSFLSGLRPETTQVFDQKTVLRKENPKVEFLPDFFKRNGYYVAAAGKVFHHGKPNAAGFDAWDPAEGSSREEEAAIKRRYAHPEGDRTPDWAAIQGAEEETADAFAARQVNAWIDEASRLGKPFFLVAGFRRPHLPWAVPKRYFDQYPAVDVPEEPQPDAAIPRIALLTELGASKPPDPRWQAIAAYRAATSFMDAQAGKILAHLDKLKLADSTIVVFVGDNGFHLGEHHLWSKHTLFERATRVPMMIAAPGIQGGGARSQRTTELLDIYPTLADLAGLTAPAHLEGHSLAPLLRNPAAAWDHPARSVVMRQGGISGRAVRTSRWRYVEWGDGGSAGIELYDHHHDPRELRNLAGQPASAATVRQMQALLKRSKGE